MTLNDIGYNEIIATSVSERNIDGLEVGRIICEQKERYFVFTAKGEYEAEITGNLRFSAENREDFPAVGDWVLLSLCENHFAVIHSVLPRSSVIKRQAIEQHSGVQIIACNIDYALIMQAADRDFNLNRLERYLTICGDSNIKPIILITKIDLCPESEIEKIRLRIKNRITGVPLIFLSNETRAGMDALRGEIQKGKTYCLLGSSGVGKSSLVNALSKKEIMKTGEISAVTNKGKHVTSYREIVVLDSGGILIDNPGMREVGIAGDPSAVDSAFALITGIAQNCRFSDCTHIHEAGCAVLEAINNGVIEKAVYGNYIKIKKETDFFASTKAEKHKKDKDFGKMVKNFKKSKKANGI